MIFWVLDKRVNKQVVLRKFENLESKLLFKIRGKEITQFPKLKKFLFALFMFSNFFSVKLLKITCINLNEGKNDLIINDFILGCNLS